MNTQEIIRPKISLLNEESYVTSFCELGYYFIEKFPKFFARIRQDDTDQFEFRVSSKKYDNPFPLNDSLNKGRAFVETVCKTMHVGWNSDKYDSHISIQIVEKVPISISFMHKIEWEDQATIYFADHSQKGIKMPGQKEEGSYDPAVLSRSAEKFFKETIGFSSERTTTIESGLDTLEKVLKKLEENQ